MPQFISTSDATDPSKLDDIVQRIVNVGDVRPSSTGKSYASASRLDQSLVVFGPMTLLSDIDPAKSVAEKSIFVSTKDDTNYEHSTLFSVDSNTVNHAVLAAAEAKMRDMFVKRSKEFRGGKQVNDLDPESNYNPTFVEPSGEYTNGTFRPRMCFKRNANDGTFSAVGTFTDTKYQPVNISRLGQKSVVALVCAAYAYRNGAKVGMKWIVEGGVVISQAETVDISSIPMSAFGLPNATPDAAPKFVDPDDFFGQA